jgi:VCBS repeat protein
MTPLRTLTAAFLILLLAAVPASAGDGRFGKGKEIPLTYPVSVAVADFNSDGRRDIAALNYADRYVSVQLTKAGGGFAEAPHVKVGENPVIVVAADFNRDTSQDLAVANVDGKSVSVRLGDGQGGFKDAPDIDVTRTPHSLVVGDFNADGTDDLAVGDYSPVDGYVTTWLSAGDGKFTKGGSVSAVSAQVLVVGDFNADGTEDLVFGADSGPSGVLKGTGGGALARGTDIELPALADRDWAVGDFNRDGNQDLAVIVAGKSVVAVRLGKGDGTFTSGKDVPVGENGWSLAVGDFNADGKEDLVVTDYDKKALDLRVGDGAGNFKPAASVPTGDSPFDIAAADFDADGNDDLAVARFVPAGAVVVHRGLGTPALAGNLLVNGGFEQPQTQASLLPGWELGGGFGSLTYGGVSHAYLPSAVDSPRYATGGGTVAWGGDSSSTNGVTTASQVVDVSGAAGWIDSGRGRARLSAYLGGGILFFDSMSARAEYRTAADKLLGSFEIGPVSVFDRKGVTAMQRRLASARVPVGTRRIRVTLTSIDEDKTYSSAFADNVKLTLNAPAFKSATRVELKRPLERIKASEPVGVRLVNGNAFLVTGTLRGRTVARFGPAQQRIALKAAPFQLKARGARTVSLTLTPTLRDHLKSKGQLGLQFTAVVRDLAGNTRTVQQTALVRLEG